MTFLVVSVRVGPSGAGCNAGSIPIDEHYLGSEVAAPVLMKNQSGPR